MTTTKRKKVFVRAKVPYKKILLRQITGNQNEKSRVKMNQPVYLGLQNLNTSKIVVHPNWYDWVKAKYEKMAKLCYMNIDSFTVQVKSDNIFLTVIWLFFISLTNPVSITTFLIISSQRSPGA